MIPVDPRPKVERDTGDLERELNARRQRRLVLGNRTEIALIEAELDDRACPDDPDGLHHVACGCDTSDVFA